MREKALWESTLTWRMQCAIQQRRSVEAVIITKHIEWDRGKNRGEGMGRYL